MKNLILIFFTLLVISVDGQTTLMLSADQDNTMYAEDNGLSNGVGIFLFAGNTATGQTRRALLRFDLSAIPSDAIVSAVDLTMQCSKSTGIDSFFVHRATKDWGEGNSDAPGQEGQGGPAMTDDATWEFNFFDTASWTTLGGDFISLFSVKGVASQPNSVTLSDGGLIDDVQAWLDGSAGNFGWILKGDETATQTALRFDSRESAGSPPSLTITFSLPPSPCAEIDTLSGTLASGTYTFPNQLASDALVLADSIVVLEAKESVELFPSFKVELQGDLEVNVEPCEPDPPE